MPYSTKTYPHSSGLSCAFRQWRAKSHCRFLHGYSLEVSFVFYADEVDANGWVVDFGSLKPIKVMLEEWFDHKTVVAVDDPELDRFQALHLAKVIDLRTVNAVGCEAFAQAIFEWTSIWLAETFPNARLRSVEVREHAGNSAIVRSRTD